MSGFAKKIADGEQFQTFILCLILLNSASMGLETVPQLLDQYGVVFEVIFLSTQAIFLVEMVIRLAAYSPRLRSFFGEFWNSFDFIVVAVSFVPVIGSFAMVARLLRVLRVLRVLSVSDRLRGFVNRLHESLDEIAYSFFVIAVFGYVFAISGNYLFFEHDPDHWATLGRSALSVLYLVLLQDLPAMVGPALSLSPFCILYFLLLYLVFFGFFLAVINAAITQSVRDSKGRGNGES